MTLKKGEITKQKIIEASAEIFNQKGYAGTSIDDIIKATGLKQGGIYRHFSSKEDIAKACFQYLAELLAERLAKSAIGCTNAKEELFAILDEFVLIVKNPQIQGGCPLLNTAIDCDDTNEEMKELVQKAVNKWEILISDILNKGIIRGEFNKDLDVGEFTNVFIATIEGGIFLSNLYDDANYLITIVNHLKKQLQTKTVKSI